MISRLEKFLDKFKYHNSTPPLPPLSAAAVGAFLSLAGLFVLPAFLKNEAFFAIIYLLVYLMWFYIYFTMFLQYRSRRDHYMWISALPLLFSFWILNLWAVIAPGQKGDIGLILVSIIFFAFHIPVHRYLKKKAQR